MARFWDRLWPKRSRESQESIFRDRAADLEISVAHPGVLAQVVRLSDLSGVATETNDSGPLGIDCWWLLVGVNDKLVVACPQGAHGDKAAVDRLMKLPGFDFDAMIAAMASVETDVYPVWRRGRTP